MCRIRSNAESRLPLEIRRKIFVEVLGNRLIHLKRLNDEGFDYDSDWPSFSYGTWHILVCDPAEAEHVWEGNTKQRTPKDEDGAKTRAHHSTPVHIMTAPPPTFPCITTTADTFRTLYQLPNDYYIINSH